MLRAARTLLLALLTVTAPATAAGTAGTAARTDDSLSVVLERWRRAVDASAWANHAGTHLSARTIASGVPGQVESWIGRDGLRIVIHEGSDQSEWVWDGAEVWWRNWNGKTRALAGRDRADGVTDAFVRALIFAGPSRAALRAAHAADAASDSTGALRVVRLTPPGGVPCDLFLDRTSGRPVRAVHKPYDDPVIVEFRDWRAVAGARLPFMILDIDREGNGDTTWVTEADLLPRPPRFARPADGASDVRFADGDRALGIPFDFENDHIMVECTVNDSKPLWFLLDTGADYNVINLPRLAQMGLTSFGDATTSGGGGSAGLSFTKVGRLTVGGVTMLDQRAGVIDVSGLEKLYGMPMGGLLGMDFIDRFTLVVDYDHRVLDLYAPGHDAGVARGTAVPFVIEEGHPHVRGAIVVDDQGEIPADFIIDSGAAESANLTMPFVRDHQLLERARRTPAPTPSVIPGTEKQFYTQTTVRGHLRSLRIGTVTVREIPVNLQQGTSGAYASPSFSGTVGERILSRFKTTYDYTHSVLYLDPDSTAAKPFPARTTFGLSLMADGEDYTHFAVAGVRKGSRADSVGFRKDDVIATLDGTPARRWRLASLRAALAEEGSRHRAEVQRGATTLPLEFTVHLISIEDR